MVKENNISNSIVIKKDKGRLSKTEIKEAKQSQERETCIGDLPPSTILEKIIKKK